MCVVGEREHKDTGGEGKKERGGGLEGVKERKKDRKKREKEGQILQPQVWRS